MQRLFYNYQNLATRPQRLAFVQNILATSPEITNAASSLTGNSTSIFIETQIGPTIALLLRACLRQR